MPQTMTEKKDRGTEKQVQDLTKKENVSSVIEQSLRSLHEMERRLIAMEAEFARITGRSPNAPGQSLDRPEMFRTSSPIGMAGGPATLSAPLGAAQGMQGSPYGAFQPPSPFAGVPLYAPPSPAGYPSLAVSPFAAPRFQLPGAPSFPPTFSPFGAAPLAGSPFQQAGIGTSPSNPWAAPFAGSANPAQAGLSGQVPIQAAGAESALGGARGGLGDGLMTRSRDLADMPPQVRQPSMDILDEGKEFTIHVELPGVKKEDLDILVTERALVLNAKMRPESEDGVIVHSERPPVVYRRNVMLGAEVNTTDAKANLKDGVLTVRIPKSTPTNGPRQLDVAYG